MRKTGRAICIGTVVAVILVIIINELQRRSIAIPTYLSMLVPFPIGGIVAGLLSRKCNLVEVILICILEIVVAIVALLVFMTHPLIAIYVFGPTLLIIGIVGGHFGGRLAQIWHKRKQSTSTSPQSQDSQHVEDAK